MTFFKLFALFPFAFFTFQSDFIPPPPQNLHGIYVTSHTITTEAGQQMIDEFAQAGGNMIVFDVQSSGGRLAYLSQIPLSIEFDNRTDKIKNLPQLVKDLHEKNFYVVARYVLFKNDFLARSKPEWTLKKRGTNQPFFAHEGPVWLDPAHPELKEYLIDISREIALSGVDEIQFDYVRFPSGGKGGYIGYSFTNSDTVPRDQAITNAVRDLSNEIHLFGAKVSLDVFGILVWDNVSWKIIGQNIKELAHYTDAIYPMPYPSHFGRGWGGHRNPADEPYFFVQETTKKFLEQTRGERAEIRPWLQGFSMGVSRYGPAYVREQIRALNDIGIDDFAVWNAANNYRTITFPALK